MVGFKTFAHGALSAALVLGLSGCGAERGLPLAGLKASQGASAAKARTTGASSRFMARNMVYALDGAISLGLPEMNADIVLDDPSKPFSPGDKEAFSLNIHAARVVLDAPTLAALLNTHVFNDRDTPIKEVSLAFENGKVKLKGKLKKVVWVSFEMEGHLTVAPGGSIHLTPTLVKALGMRLDGLMDLVGLDIAKLLQTKKEKGVTIQGNAIVIDPLLIIPPPRLIGQVTGLTLQGPQLELVFNDGKAKPFPAMPVPEARNFIAIWGGTVLLNSIEVKEARIQICDADPSDPLHYALGLYKESLQAGFVTPLLDGALVAYVPDVRNFDAPLGRFAPIQFPVPGIPQQRP